MPWSVERSSVPEPVVERLAKQLRVVRGARQDRSLGLEPLLQHVADDAKSLAPDFSGSLVRSVPRTVDHELRERRGGEESERHLGLPRWRFPDCGQRRSEVLGGGLDLRTVEAQRNLEIRVELIRCRRVGLVEEGRQPLDGGLDCRVTAGDRVGRRLDHGERPHRVWTPCCGEQTQQTAIRVSDEVRTGTDNGADVCCQRVEVDPIRGRARPATPALVAATRPGAPTRRRPERAGQRYRPAHGSPRRRSRPRPGQPPRATSTWT